MMPAEMRDSCLQPLNHIDCWVNPAFIVHSDKETSAHSGASVGLLVSHVLQAYREAYPLMC